MTIVFLAFLQQLWESWGLRNETGRSFPGLLLMITGPVMIYLISHLLFPEDIQHTDFDAHYHDNARIFAGLAVFAVAMATLFRPLSFGHTLIEPDNIASLVMLVAFGLLALTNNRRVHQIVLPALLILMLMDILVFTMRI